MEIKEYPSKRYFELVKTKEDYLLLVSSGMAWEVEPHCPISWQEHLQMVVVRYKKRKEKSMNEVVIKVISAVWCPGCASLKHSLDTNNIPYQVVDADNFENHEYISKLGIKSLPVTVLEVDGEIKGKIQGLVSVASLRKAIDDVVAEMENK